MLLPILSVVGLFSVGIFCQLQYCKVPIAGPCQDGKCPAQHSCILATEGEVCCDEYKIGLNVDEPSGSQDKPEPARPASNLDNQECKDKTNPHSGESDCPQNSHLCNDTRYLSLMTEQCPRTCGRCPDQQQDNAVTPVTSDPPAESNNCVDSVNPRTGVTNCPLHPQLCNDSLYRQLMSEKCPKTCGRCSDQGNSNVSTPSTEPSGCFDRLNPTTGVSDCPRSVDLCRNPAYLSLMQEHCPRTCEFCS